MSTTNHSTTSKQSQEKHKKYFRIRYSDDANDVERLILADDISHAYEIAASIELVYATRRVIVALYKS